MATAMATSALAQHTLTTNRPVLLQASSDTQWQMKQAVATSAGLLITGQCRRATEPGEVLVMNVNAQGDIRWQRSYEKAVALSIASGPDGTAVLVSRWSGLIRITKIDCKQQGAVRWEKVIGHGIRGSATVRTDGKIGVITDDGSVARLLEVMPDGLLNWETTLPKIISERYANLAITALDKGGYAVTGGNQIWGTDEKGQIGWTFEAKAEHIQWETVRQVSSGEVVVVGAGQSNILNNNCTDAHVWGIAADGSRVAWSTLIGSEKNRERAYDISETSDGQLMVLCRRNDQTELVLLNHQHHPESVYLDADPSPAPSFRCLLASTTPDTWLAVGNVSNDEQSGIAVQTFQQKISAETIVTKKPSLFLVAIGTNTTLHYPRQDAEAIAQLFQTQQGGIFENVDTDLLIADSVTTGGYLGRTFELLSTKRMQAQDLLIVFFSGNGQRTDDNYLLMGSDYNPAALRTTTFPMTQLLADLNNLPGRKLVLLDACHSGAATSTKLNIPQGISVLTGSLADQTAYEDRVWGHGAFTKTILMALQNAGADANHDGFITVQELYKHTAYQLPRLVKYAKNVQQQPTLWQTDTDFPIFKVK